MKFVKNIISVCIAIFLSLTANAQFIYDIYSTPDSASVFINGEETCVTPCRHKFYWRDNVDGQISFAVKAPGFKTWGDTLFKKPYQFDFEERITLERELPIFNLDSATAVVGFDKLLIKFDDGAKIGSYKKMNNVEEPIKWEGSYKIGVDSFNKKFYELISHLGFRTPFNDKVELFNNDHDKVRLPRYLVGAQITDYEIRLDEMQNFNKAIEIKSVTTMDIDWKVLDKKTNKVVLSHSNRGVARTRQGRFNQSPDNLLAFEDALYEFLEKSDFYKLVNDTEMGIDYMSQTDSAANPPRVISLPTIPTFEKLSDMIKYANPACVTIVTDGGFGSGVVINNEGYVLSAYHVVDGVNQIDVKFSNGLTLDAKVIAFDYANDIVLLDINGSGFHALPVSTSTEVPLGEEVITIGTPASIELGQSIARGLVSGKRIVEDRVYLQADISVSPGNSGGPLLNANGEVIGIVQSKIVEAGVEGIGFALPMDRALERLNLTVKPE